MKRAGLLITVVASLSAGLYLGSAADTAKPSLAFGDLEKEARAQLAKLIPKMADEATFAEGRKRSLPQAAGVLASVANAAVILPEAKTATWNVAAVRDEAAALAKAETWLEAQPRWAALQMAFQTAADQSPAPKLTPRQVIDVDSLMEEVNERNAKIRALRRRIRKPDEDSLHAVTVSVLARAIQDYADDYTSSDDERKLWTEQSALLENSMAELAGAIQKKDQPSVDRLMDVGAKTCTDCHAKFNPK